MKLPIEPLATSARALSVALVAGCASAPPLPDMSQARSSALAIEVLVKPPMGKSGERGRGDLLQKGKADLSGSRWVKLIL